MSIVPEPKAEQVLEESEYFEDEEHGPREDWEATPLLDDTIRQLMKKPCMILIVGDPEAGKTDIMFLLMERALDLGLVSEAASNMASDGIWRDGKLEPSPIQDVHSLARLKFWLKTRRRKIYGFDDVVEHLPRRAPMSHKTVSILSIIPTVRKARAILIWITQDPELSDSTLLNDTFTKAMIIKVSKKTAKIISPWLKNDRHERTLFQVPPTHIKFNTWDYAPFELEEDVIPTGLKNDEELQLLYRWSVEGFSSEQLGLHPMKLNRILRKFVAEQIKQYTKQETPQ